MTGPDPQPRVDPEHPWPALLSFREDDQRYFGGRDEEVEALYRRIGASRLTLLFGLSGLGKTSLLRAGLFPRLRREHYFPVYVRLRYGRDLPSPVEQIQAEIVAQARASGVEAPEPHPGETLWQYFHRGDADFWDDRNHPSTPVLVFDQFEELFTKSREVPEHANEVIEELANLAEGASPALLREAAERDRSLLRQVFDDRYRLVIGIRSDYLAQLQGISDRVRAVFANRYELHRMNGAAALQSTLTAGGNLMEEEVARRVVRFVAGAPESDGPPQVDGLQVEPALLSLVCSELNATRIRNGEPAITASMLSGSKDEILSRFYEASFADVAPELRVLVEDKLVTRDGKGRNFISEQTARETAGVTEEDLGKLVHRRLLRFEESGSSRRMELTHDLLTAVAAASRSNREHRMQIEEARAAKAEAERREAAARRALRRSRAAMLVFFVLLAVAVAGPFVAARWTATGARRIEAEFYSNLVRQKLSSDETSEGLMYLARVVRLDPGNAAARTLLYQQLLTRSWLVPVRTFAPQGRVDAVAFSADGARGAFRAGRMIEVRDVATGRPVGSPLDLGFEPRSVRFGRDGWTLLFDAGQSGGADRPLLWNPRASRPTTLADLRKLPGVPPCPDLQVFDVSANGKELAAQCDEKPAILAVGPPARWEALATPDLAFEVKRAEFAPDPRFVVFEDSWFTTVLLDRRSGTNLLDVATKEKPIAFSRDGKRVAIVKFGTQDIEVRDLASSVSLGKFDAGAPPLWTIFDRAGSTVMTWSNDDAVRLWNAGTGDISALPGKHPRLFAVGFSPDGALIFTVSEGMARWWSVYDSAPLHEPLVQPKILAASMDPAGDLVTVSNEAHVWQLAGSPLPPALAESVPVEDLDVSEDRNTAIVHEEGRLVGWDAVSGKKRWTSPEGATFVAIDATAARAVVRDESGALSVVAIPAWKPLWKLPDPVVELNEAVFSGDGTAVVLDEVQFGDGQSGTLLLSAATGARLAPLIHVEGQTFLKANHDGSLLAFRRTGKLLVWNVRERRAVLDIPITATVEPDEVDFSPDGRSFAVVTGGALQVWDVAARSKRVTTLDTALREVQFSPDGRSLAMRLDEGVALCDARTLDCTGKDRLLHADALGMEFSTNGKRMLTATTSAVRVWDVATQQPVSLPLPWEKFTGLSPDGMFLFGVANGELYRVPLPSIGDDDAAHLADLAEALAGTRVDRLGSTEPVSGTKALADLGKRCQDTPGPACDIVRWLLTAPGKRTISPVSTLRVPDYVKRRRTADASADEWWRLKALFPTEPALGPRP